LRHRPLLLSFSLSPLLVCLFSHKINNVSPQNLEKKRFSPLNLILYLSAVYLFCIGEMILKM
jgi:hypothetical protein